MQRFLRLAILILAVTSTLTAAGTQPAKKKTSDVQESTAKPGPAIPAPNIKRASKIRGVSTNETETVAKPGPIPAGPPVERQLTRASSRRFDLRSLPRTRPIQQDRVELPEPVSHPVTVEGTIGPPTPDIPVGPPTPSLPAPAPLNVFEGLDRFNWGAGSPPDTNGDAGPNEFIQTVNTSIGVFRKSDGFQEAAFTFNTFMSQGNFGNLCDTNNFGDPVVLYDTFDDRWIITDFAFLTDVSGNVLAPAYQCFAASMTGDPVAGGWNFYSIQITDALNDYPKFGIWPDGLYMSSNMFTFGAGSTFTTARVWAFNKAQMYAGSPTVKVVTFNVPGGDFTVVPSNARLQTGTPPPGRPNLFLSSWFFLNALTVYKFHVDWDHISLSTFTGPDVPTSASTWPTFAPGVPQPGTATLLDSLSNRAMVQNQYTNFSGTESLWVSHTVRRLNATGFAAPRWYQVNVTGGTVALAIPQAATWDPDAANLIHRWMPSVALDRAGNLAMGYSTSNATTEFPSIKYAGRLAADAANTFSKTEQTFFSGTASQTGSTRWGDYSAMTLDPDGCTFWYTTEYANPADQTFNHRWLTKFGSFRFTECTTVGAGGTISGTVTTNPGGAPISGATVMVGARSATSNGSGNYSFSVPAGMYPSMNASKPAFGSASATSLLVTDGNTTTQNFALTAAPPSSCLTDTTQGDFLTGVPTGVDMNLSPGDVTLSPAPSAANAAGTTTGTGFGTPNWTGQTFIPTTSGSLFKVDIQLFCNGCGATPPNLTLSVRNTAAGLPTGADLATVTIPGSAFGSGLTVPFTAIFGAPATLTSGTQYALVLRPVSVPAGGGYFWIRSSPSTYASGSRVLSADSGGTWSADTTRDYNFVTYIGSVPSGNLVSSPRDSNPSGGLTPIWSTFSWNASTPANTSLTFQLAGSNNVNGPFNFVGPDGTAGTFFTTSPVQLSPQFYNFRYLEYKALLSTTDSTVTPTLNDATACFNDVDCSSTVATITPTPAQVCANSTGNTASGPAGMTSYAWGIANGTITSATNTQSITYTAGASGSVTLNLTVIAPNGCIVSGNAPVSINPLPPTPTISGTLAFCTGFSTTLTSSSASGNQWFLNGNPIGGATNQTYIATAGGNYTVTVTDGNNCTSAASATATVTVTPLPPTPTITPGGPTTFCIGGSVMLTSSSASGNQWFLNGNPIGGATNQTYTATASGNYTVTVTSAGCTSPASPATTVTVNPLPPTPTITPGGPTTFCLGGSVTLTSSSASGNQWFLNGNPIGGETNQTYVATASGNYTVTATDGNSCTSAASATTTVTVNPIPPTPTITPGGPTTFCIGGSVTLTSSSATGNQWFLNGNPIGGATNQTYSATASGNYTLTVTSLGCTSAPSAATTVTVNPLPATPTITPGGPTTFCAGGSVTLTSSSASGNQWFQNGNPIGGATNQTYISTASGNYTVNVTDINNCTSAASAGVVVTVNPIPATPTITPGGPTTFCVGGSVTLTSSGASGNQWFLNGNPIGGATNTTYSATASGNYTVIVTSLGCTSPASSTTTVTVNPLPPTPTITPGGPTTFCAGGSVTLTSSSATGNQWFLNGNPIGGATNSTYSATASGNYTVKATDINSCTSAASAGVVVTVNPIPATPTITPGGPTTFCIGGSVTLTSSGASGNQWFLNGNPIGGATNQTYSATASGNYTVIVTSLGCTSAPSAATTVTVNPIPATPTITPGGPTTFCAGGSVTLTSSSNSGNQWLLNGNPIGGATNQTFTASIAGDYSVTTTALGCSSPASTATTVTINPLPNAAITTPASIQTLAAGNASVANAGAGATYGWGITNGAITGGSGTSNITFTAGSVGTLTLTITGTTSAGCSSSQSTNVNVTAIPPVTVTSTTPALGTFGGGTSVTISGNGFQSGAAVTFAGSSATNIVVVNATTITAKTPAHAVGAVNVTVTNTDTGSGTLTNGFNYVQQFDPNGDNVIDPADIFFLVNYLFTSGPAPHGAVGLLSGDANGDSVVDPADIFYTINYLFTGGPQPMSLPSRVVSTSNGSIAGSLILGKPIRRGDKYFVPVVLTPARGADMPQALTLTLRFNADLAGNVGVQRAGVAMDLAPLFEISRASKASLSYLVVFDPRRGGLVAGSGDEPSTVIAEIEIAASGAAGATIEVDPTLTMLSDQGGTRTANVANGKLRVAGVTITERPTIPQPKSPEVK